MESELVSGFMTEHAAVIFVFFFLAEYASIVLICILTSILFLGGYLLNIMPFLYLWYIMDISTVYLVNDLMPALYSFFILLEPVENISLSNPFTSENLSFFMAEKESIIFDPLMEGIISGVILGVKSCIMIFIFIWARASLRRKRFDELMSLCWTVLLPILLSIIIINLCILFSSEIFPLAQFSLMTTPISVLQVDKKDVHLNTSLHIKGNGSLISIPVNKRCLQWYYRKIYFI